MIKHIILLLPLLLLASCTQPAPTEEEKEFLDSGRAKAIEREEDLWQFFLDEEIDISLNYPHSISLGDIDENKPLRLTVEIDPIEGLEGTMGYNKETALTNMEALTTGEYGEDVDFQSEESKTLRKIGKTYAQDFVVLSRFEVCNVVFERKLYFFHNDHQIVITLYGDADEIIKSSPEYFIKNPENCGEEIVWDYEKQDGFIDALKEGNGSDSAQEWFDTFNRIINTIKL